MQTFEETMERISAGLNWYVYAVPLDGSSADCVAGPMSRREALLEQCLREREADDAYFRYVTRIRD